MDQWDGVWRGQFRVRLLIWCVLSSDMLSCIGALQTWWGGDGSRV